MATGLLCLMGLVTLALFGARLAPYEPIYFVVEHGADPRPYEPGLVFPLGSDVLGRDLLSLVLAGARATLTIVVAAGLARVLAGLLAAGLRARWPRIGVGVDTLADLLGAVPATLVALLLIKAFVQSDTSLSVMVGALLVTGWAGPYRVIRAELDRISRTGFTEGARALGVSRARLFWRHQFPHLMPLLATNLAQQVVASLVLVAELGVLGVIVSPVRTIDVQESLSVVRTGPPMSARVPDVPEWGAMLSSARTTEILWATRWVLLVPGAAFALTAVAVALLGFALARRYARRDVVADLRGASVLAVAIVVLSLASTLLPGRYAAASEWATAARAAIGDDVSARDAFTSAGLLTQAVRSEAHTVVRDGRATLAVGGASVTEDSTAASVPAHVRALVSGTLGGGGVVEAPLVFVSRGITLNDQALPPAYSRQRDAQRARLAPYLASYPDDYAGIDVRGKVVLLARFMGIDAGRAGFIDGFPVATSIASALGRGAAAVIFVDPFASDVPAAGRGTNPYIDIERQDPPGRVDGAPVIVLDRVGASALLPPLGLDLEPYLNYDPAGTAPVESPARDLGVLARIRVPLQEQVTTATSLIGIVPGTAENARVVVWASRSAGEVGVARTRAVGALARLAAARHIPFVFVDFDPAAGTAGVREALGARSMDLVLVLGQIDREALHFTTANGDLIPALDLYASEAGAKYEVTRTTASIQQVVTPLPGVRTVVIDSVGEADSAWRDTTAMLGYLAGRYMLGAPELPR